MKKGTIKTAVITTIILLVILVFVFIILSRQIPLGPPEPVPESKWFLPKDFKNQPAWGIKNGIIISTWPGNLGGIAFGGPKGLFRIYKHGEKGLAWVNFISVEPVTTNFKMGFSELESRLFVPNPYSNLNNPRSIISTELPSSYNNIAYFTEPQPGVQQLNLLFGIQEYKIGAKVYVTAHIRDDKPDEIEFRTYKHDDSVDLRMIRLSSTAGNFNHLRLLYLKDEVVDSRVLYKGYKGTGKKDFALPKKFEFDKLLIDSEGSLIVAATRGPNDVDDFFNDYFRRYELTQYFKKYKGYYTNSAFAAVNAKYVYWHSGKPIAGGIAYENFELDEPFRQGQSVWFGATEKIPQQLGFS